MTAAAEATTSNNKMQLEVSRPRPALLSSLTAVAAGTAVETMSGYVGGYFLGMATDCTRRCYWGFKDLLRPTTATAAAASTAEATSILPYSSLMRMSQNSLQMHARSMQWATEWGKVSAMFCACRWLSQSLRHNRDDEWNSVFGSAMAGAIFAGGAAGAVDGTQPRSGHRGKRRRGGARVAAGAGESGGE